MIDVHASSATAHYFEQFAHGKDAPTSTALAERLVAADHEIRDVLGRIRTGQVPAHHGSMAHYYANITKTMLNGVQEAFPESQRNPNDPAYRAAELIGQELDRRSGINLSVEDQDYHNRAHYFDVAMSVTGLGLIDMKTSKDGAPLTMADAIDYPIMGALHDLYHPGGNNEVPNPAGGPNLYEPFKIEWMTCEHVQGLLSKAGYPQERIDGIKTQILSTDPRLGPPLLRMSEQYRTNTDPAARAEIKAQSDALIEKSFADMPNNQDMKERRAAMMGMRDTFFSQDEKSQKLTKGCHLLTAADISFSLLSPETHAINTYDFQRELEKAGSPIKFYDEKGHFGLGGFVFFAGVIAGVDISKEGDVRDTPMANPIVERTFGAAFRNTARYVVDLIRSDKAPLIGPATADKPLAEPQTHGTVRHAGPTAPALQH